jgi:hypothetical protein
MNKMMQHQKKEDFIRKQLQRWFITSPVRRQLMESVWHPRNFQKFKYLDPETFGGLDEEEEGSF